MNVRVTSWFGNVSGVRESVKGRKVDCPTRRRVAEQDRLALGAASPNDEVDPDWLADVVDGAGDRPKVELVIGTSNAGQAGLCGRSGEREVDRRAAADNAEVVHRVGVCWTSQREEEDRQQGDA